MTYDIFISYRRTDNEGKTSGRDIARSIKKELELRGYKVFFDYSECTDGEFENAIIPAIRECKFFLLILTKDSLDRCAQENDWVRREIREAIETNRKIIPIVPDGQFQKYPINLPIDISSIKEIQNSPIDMGALFEKSIDKLEEDRLKQKKSLKINKIWLYIIVVIVGISIWLFWSKGIEKNTVANNTTQVNDIDSIFNLANNLSAKGNNIGARSYYKKVTDYHLANNSYTRQYFHSYYMYLEFLRKDNMLESDARKFICDYNRIIKQIDENVKFDYLSASDSAWIVDVKMRCLYKLGYDYYYGLHNLDSSYFYMTEVEDYFSNCKDSLDSLKLEEIARIKQKWTIKKRKL